MCFLFVRVANEGLLFKIVADSELTQ